jgi:hypothetical protein
MTAAAQEVADWVAGYAGAYNVMHDLRPGKPELRIRMAQGAHAMGLTAQNVADQLRAGFLGTVASTIQFGGEILRHPGTPADPGPRQPGRSRRLHRHLAGRSAGAAAHRRHGRDGARLRQDHPHRGERTVTVQANVDGRKGNAEAMVADMQATFCPLCCPAFPI